MGCLMATTLLVRLSFPWEGCTKSTFVQEKCKRVQMYSSTVFLWDSDSVVVFCAVLENLPTAEIGIAHRTGSLRECLEGVTDLLLPASRHPEIQP